MEWKKILKKYKTSGSGHTYAYQISHIYFSKCIWNVFEVFLLYKLKFCMIFDIKCDMESPVQNASFLSSMSFHFFYKLPKNSNSELISCIRCV